MENHGKSVIWEYTHKCIELGVRTLERWNFKKNTCFYYHHLVHYHCHNRNYHYRDHHYHYHCHYTDDAYTRLGIMTTRHLEAHILSILGHGKIHSPSRSFVHESPNLAFPLPRHWLNLHGRTTYRPTLHQATRRIKNTDTHPPTSSYRQILLYYVYV